MDNRNIEDRIIGTAVLCVLLFVLLAALLGCGTRTLEDVAPTGEFGELVIDAKGSIQVVQGSNWCASTQCRAFVPWRRIDDSPGEVRWLISSVGHACLMNDAQFTLALGWARRQVRCHWRSAR